MGLGVVVTHWGDTSKLKGVKKPEAMSRSGQTKRRGTGSRQWGCPTACRQGREQDCSRRNQ